MSAPTIEYRGYTIRYGENNDKWWCSDIGFEHEKASKVKERIDDLHRKLRKASSLACIVIREHANPLEAREGRIVEYLGEKKDRSYYTGKTEIVGHKVAIMSKRSGGEREGRQECLIEELASADDPVVTEKIEMARQIDARIAALAKERRAIIAAIPRLTIKAIPDLIRASEHRFEEGEAESQAPKSK